MTRNNILDNIPCDKRLHIVIGILVFIPQVFLLKGIGIDYHREYALLTAVIVGILIEFYQRSTKTGAFEYKDMIATAFGGLLGYMASYG
jgi:glycopeptide antibiotics resistance protein